MAVQERVRAFVEQNPGATRAQIGRATGLPGIVVAWSLRRMQHEAHVTEMEDDGQRRYFVDGPVMRREVDPAIA